MLTPTLLFVLAIGISAQYPDYCRTEKGKPESKCTRDFNVIVGKENLWYVYNLKCLLIHIHKQFLRAVTWAACFCDHKQAQFYAKTSGDNFLFESMDLLDGHE